MKEIIVLTLKKCFSYIMNSKKKYSIIHITGSKEKDIPFEFKESKKCSEVMKLSFEENVFTLYQADRIIRFCERQFDIDTVIVTCEGKSLNRAYNLADAIKECYCLSGKDFTYDKIYYLHKDIKNIYNAIRNSPINTMPPMEYCLKIIEITIDQIRDIIGEAKEDRFPSYEFFCQRQCDIFLKNGIKITWHIETGIGNIVIPDLDEIEHICFSGVPEIAYPGSFDPVHRYRFECKFGIHDFFGQKFSLDSTNGIVRTSDNILPEKYKDYRYIQREWYEFPAEGAKNKFPEMEDAYAGMLAAEEFLASETGYEPRFTNIPFNHPHEYPIYSSDFFDVLDTVMCTMQLEEMWEYDLIECMCAYAAYIYTGILCYCGHCENLSILREILSKVFNRTSKITLFDKLWKIADTNESELVIDDDPINMLCIAIYSLIETVRPLNEQKLPKGTYSKCLRKAFELTKGKPELANAVIMAGAFAGVYCQAAE